MSKCKGMNCGATDGISHSAECEAEHAASVAGGVFVKQPVGEVKAVEGIPIPTGHAEADRIIGRLMSSDPDFQDCTDAAALIQREICGPDGFATWREAALAERIKRTPQPVSEVPMPEAIGRLHFGGVSCGELEEWEFDAYQGVCDRINESAITESLQDVYLHRDVRTYGDAREVAGYARGLAEADKLAHTLAMARSTFKKYADLHSAKGTDDGREKAAANMRLVNLCDAALRGEVK